MKNLLVTTAAALVSLVLALGPASRAADHDNLEEGLPTQVEDAYPIPFGNHELQGFARYQERSKRGRDLHEWFLQPQYEWGIFPNTQLGVAVPFKLKDADPYGSGDTHFKLLYNFNTEGKWMPAIAVAGEAVAPTGEENTGVDTGAKLILTKTITKTGLDRIHLNAGWKHNDENGAMEREDRFVGVIGYSRRLNADTVLVADYVHEQEREENETADIVELGVRRQITPRLVLSGGAGAGLNDDSPDWRVTIGFQYSIGRLRGKPSGRTIETILMDEKPVKKP